MQMVLTLLGPETSAGATWQHLGLQNCTWSVQEGFILVDFLMDLRYLLTSTAILLFWVLSLPQNNPEYEAWTSMELCEPLITPPGFPEWRSLCFLLLLGSQGLNEVLGLVNARWPVEKSWVWMWNPEEVSAPAGLHPPCGIQRRFPQGAGRGNKHFRSATASIPISRTPLGRGERSKAPLKSLFFPDPFPHAVSLAA